MRGKCGCRDAIRKVSDSELSVEIECPVHGEVTIYGRDFDFDD
jgi:hypothetical protein